MKLASILLALLFLASSAAAEPDRPRPAAATREAKRRARRPPAKRAGPARPVRRYDFEGDTIPADRLQPDGTTMFGVIRPRFAHLIVLRGDFLSEIIRDADGR